MPEDLEKQLEHSGEKKESQEERFKRTAEKMLESEQRNIEEILKLDFSDPDLGYSEKEAEKVDKVREDFKSLLTEAEDDPEKTLGILGDRGITVVKDSAYLKKHAKKAFLGIQSLVREMMKEPAGVGAVFMTPEQIKKALDSGHMPVEVKKELEGLQESNGAILLDKAPIPKSIFHESVHALQYREGLNMDVQDNEALAKRELEANWTMVKTKEEDGMLKDVSKLSHDIKKGSIGGKIVVPRVVYHANDIAYESIRFRNNLSNLKEAVAEKKNGESLEDARSKIEALKKKEEGESLSIE